MKVTNFFVDIFMDIFMEKNYFFNNMKETDDKS